ncbi:hypothetical protein Taro_036178, partial [Colocasia esculenta]|nr:hypothetical protein [Colocasia esculenta]
NSSLGLHGTYSDWSGIGPTPIRAGAEQATCVFYPVAQIHKDYTLPIPVDDDDDDPDPEFTAAARASRRSYAEEDERRRDLGTSRTHLSRDDSRRSLPSSTSGPMDAYLYRSRSIKQPRIKHALKGVKATAKGAIKDVDELLNEEHPLHAWVETRAEGHIPDFHPDDRLVQACEEDVLLEEHVPERGERPELRRSSTVHNTRISSSQPELRRSTSQLDPKRKKDKGKKKAKANKERRTEEPRRKSQEGE